MSSGKSSMSFDICRVARHRFLVALNRVGDLPLQQKRPVLVANVARCRLTAIRERSAAFLRSATASAFRPCCARMPAKVTCGPGCCGMISIALWCAPIASACLFCCLYTLPRIAQPSPYTAEASYRAELARGRIQLVDVDAVLDREPDSLIFAGLSRGSLRRAMITPGVRWGDHRLAH